MIVKDEARQQRDRATQQIEAYADQVNRWTKEVLGNGTVVLGDDNAVINPAKQKGHLMMPDQFERIVRSLSPNLSCAPHETNPTKRVVWWTHPAGRHGFPMHENGPMPEYSIFKARYVWVPDTDYVHVDRKDATGAPVTLEQADSMIKRLGFRGALAELRKRNQDTDTNVRPGMKRVPKLWGEAIRGWRTHLVYILQSGAVTLNDIERALRREHLPFSADNASWATLTGQQQRSKLPY